MKPPYPSNRVLAEMVRCNDSRAIRYIVAAVKRAGGSVKGAAEALGVPLRTLYYWRDSSEALGAALAEHGLGRAGAGPNAARARARRRR